MPRPEEKPPTEGGKITEIYQEFKVDITPENIFSFFVKKIAQLELKNYELEQEIEKFRKG